MLCFKNDNQTICNKMKSKHFKNWNFSGLDTLMTLV